MVRTLYCATSGCVVQMSDFTPTCSVCGRPTVWRTMPWTTEAPSKAYELTRGDRALLHALHITADE